MRSVVLLALTYSAAVLSEFVQKTPKLSMLHYAVVPHKRRIRSDFVPCSSLHAKGSTVPLVTNNTQERSDKNMESGVTASHFIYTINNNNKTLFLSADSTRRTFDALTKHSQ